VGLAALNLKGDLSGGSGWYRTESGGGWDSENLVVHLSR